MAYTSFMQILGLHNRTAMVAALALLAALAFAVRLGPTLEALQYLALTALLAWASVEDLRSRTIPNPCVIAAVIVRAAYFAILAAWGSFDADKCLYCCASGLGTGVALVIFGLAFERVTGREGIGGGDVKLYAVSGLYLGAGGAALVILVSCVLALVAAFLTRGSQSEKTGLTRTLPFGPAIAAAIILVALVAPC